jgi:hypothetical protein
VHGDGYKIAAEPWLLKARAIREAKEEKWRASHPKSDADKPCPPQTMCFDPAPTSGPVAPRASAADRLHAASTIPTAGPKSITNDSLAQHSNKLTHLPS